jgi:predicted nucleic acid-binding protein
MRSAAQTIVIAHITQAEIVSGAMRRKREGSVTARTARTVRLLIDRHVSREYRVVGLTSEIIRSAEDRLEVHSLRTYDAIQLASALASNTRLITAGLSPLIFVSAATRLLQAAAAEGLMTDDPNAHPWGKRQMGNRHKACVRGSIGPPVASRASWMSLQCRKKSTARGIAKAIMVSYFDGLSTQVEVGVDEGLKYNSSIHCDELIRIPKSSLTSFIGTLSPGKIVALNRALAIAVAIDAPAWEPWLMLRWEEARCQ